MNKTFAIQRHRGEITHRPLKIRIRSSTFVISVVGISLCLLSVIPLLLHPQRTIDPTEETLHESAENSKLSLLPWRNRLKHKKGFQYTLSFRRPNGKWKNPIKSFQQITASDLRDLDLPLFPSEPIDVSTKDFVLDLLAASGVNEIDNQVVQALPTWQKFSTLYGETNSPIIVGMEKCSEFRNKKTEMFLGVAGLFNTGTTTLDLYIRENLILTSFPNQDGFNKGVPWGKHRLWSLREEFMPDEFVNKIDQVFPVVIIRDPFTWMQSMCTSPYKAKWPHSERHCPNLIADEEDATIFPGVNEGDLIPTVLTSQKQRSFLSLLHLWVEWYAEYLFSDQPRLIVRFEDVLIRPDAVVDKIQECLQLERQQEEFVYVVGPIKWDQKYVKKQSSMVSAIIKYGNGIDRIRNMTQNDLKIAKEVLSEGNGRQLSSLFHYFVDSSD